MNNVANLLLLCLIYILVGCGRYYYQEGRTYTESERDWAVCVYELNKHKTVLDYWPFCSIDATLLSS